MAAVFPQAAACQDNATGPIEIPDHLLVRQTHRRHPARGARRRRAPRPARARSRRGEVAVHCVDTTEPSVLAHEIITARPYAFLDDEEFQNRRTNAVQLRRGLDCRPRRRSARSTPRPSSRCTPRSRPSRPPPTTCTTCCRSLVVLAGRVPSGADAVRRARGARPRPTVRPRRASSCGARPRRVDDADLALERRGRRGRRRSLRGHLELAGITTVDALAGGHDAAARSRGASALARAASTRASRSRAATRRAPTATEWVARRLLARMHSLLAAHPPRRASSPPPRRTSCGSCCGGSTSRPGTQLAGEAGLVAVLEQLQGFEAAAVAWEPELLARRLRHYEPAVARPALPRRRGRLAAAHAPRPRRRRRAGRRAVEGHARSPSCSAPISPGCSTRHAPSVDAGRADGRRHGRDRRGAAAHGARASRPSSPRPPAACPKTSSAACGTASPAACSRPTASARSGPGSRRGASAPRRPSPAAVAAAAAAPRPAGAPPGGGRSSPPDATVRHRPRRAGRSGGRAAAPPLGRRVPRPGRARLAPRALARRAVGAAPARGSRPRPGRPVRDAGSAASSTRCPKPSSSSPTCASCRAPASGWS